MSGAAPAPVATPLCSRQMGTFATLCQAWLSALRASGYAASQQRLADGRAPNTRFLDLYFARELFWLFSPPLAVVALLALGYLIWRHRAADTLLLCLVGANLLFYMVYHQHTYDLDAIALFVARAVGGAAETLLAGKTRQAVAAVAIAAVVLAVFSVTMLGAKKAGYWTSADLADALRARVIPTAGTVIALDPGFRASWEPALLLYAQGLRFVSNPLERSESIRVGERIVTLDSSPRPDSADTTQWRRFLTISCRLCSSGMRHARATMRHSTSRCRTPSS